MADKMFNPAPLLDAAPIVQIHASAALAALVCGLLLFLVRKGDGRHRRLGRIWVGLMAVAAVSSFGISERPVLLGLGPIHVLSVLTLAGLWQAVVAARAGRIDVHQKAMRSLYFFALVAAGLFTLLPGRRLHAVFIADLPVLGTLEALPLAALFAAVLAGAYLVLRRAGKI